MKKSIVLTLASFALFSCAKRIGDLTMISTRNVDSKTEYVELSRYVKSKGKTVEIAIDKAIKTVPGGEFMKNVTIYSNGKIEGDVWGIGGKITKREEVKVIEQQQAVQESSPFEIGDKVTWKNAGQFNKAYTGSIVSKGDEYASIKLDNGDTVKVKYKVLSKVL